MAVSKVGEPSWIAFPAPLPHSSAKPNAVWRAASADMTGNRPISTRRVWPPMSFWKYQVFERLPTKRTSPRTSLSQYLLVPSVAVGSLRTKVSVSLGILSAFCREMRDIRCDYMQSGDMLKSTKIMTKKLREVR